MSEEWGPWIKHDGNGCPVKGMTVEVDHYHPFHGLERGLLIKCVDGGRGWDDRPEDSNVVRYRIRKPRALRNLIQLVEDLPAPQPERTDT